MDEYEIIRRFVKTYNTHQKAQFTITRWPDKEKLKRGERACDSYAEAPEVRSLAIEHTNIETFRKQKLDSVRFSEVIGVLETELKHAFPYDVHLAIPIFGIQPGTDWNAITSIVRAWLLTNASTLPFGSAYHHIDGVPFSVSISKKDRHSTGFGVARWAPAGLDSHDELNGIVAYALENKNDQLQKYRANGDETILILESDDIALMNHVLLYKAFLQASSCIPTPNIDQVWMAQSIVSESACTFICFNGPDSIMEEANLSKWMLGKQYASYWLAEIERDKASQRRTI